MGHINKCSNIRASTDQSTTKNNYIHKHGIESQNASDSPNGELDLKPSSYSIGNESSNDQNDLLALPFAPCWRDSGKPSSLQVSALTLATNL
jgi:hypothetical protein